MVRKLAVLALAAVAPFSAGATTVSLDLSRSADLLQGVPFDTITFDPVPVAFGGGQVTIRALSTISTGVFPQRLRVRDGFGLSIDGNLIGQPNGQEQFVDTVEFLRLDFSEPVRNLSYGLSATSNLDRDGLIGERFTEVLSPDGALLARVAESGSGSDGLSAALSPEALVGSLILRPDGDGFTLRFLGFDRLPEPEPEPAAPVAAVPLPPAAPLLLAALAGLGFVSRLSVRRSGLRAPHAAAMSSSAPLRAPSRPEPNAAAPRG